MKSISSSVDITKASDGVYLRNWKEGGELDFSFLFDDLSSKRRLVIEKKWDLIQQFHGVRSLPAFVRGFVY
jgi:hypothetical protein